MKKKVNLSLDDVVAENLKMIAEEEHKPVSQWVTDAVVQAMKDREITIKEQGGSING